MSRRKAPEYWVWANMIQRCFNIRNPRYHRYGGRGITVCARWREYENFIADMGIRPSNQHSLDREENDKGYCPENCRWATKHEQARNRVDNILITHNGQTKTVMEWLEVLNLNYYTYKSRLEKGLTRDEALFTPLKQYKHFHNNKPPRWMSSPSE
jgi:hypothetical protein